MMPAMHYRLRYRQILIQEISVLTIVISVASEPTTRAAETAESHAASAQCTLLTGEPTVPANQAADLPPLLKRVDSCDEVDY